jgi:hypothetical protein
MQEDCDALVSLESCVYEDNAWATRQRHLLQIRIEEKRILKAARTQIQSVSLELQPPVLCVANAKDVDPDSKRTSVASVGPQWAETESTVAVGPEPGDDLWALFD